MNKKDAYINAMEQIHMSRDCESQILNRKEKNPERISRRTLRPAALIAVLIIAIAAMGFTAYKLGFFETFRQFVIGDDAVMDMPERFSYMDMEQLKRLSSDLSERVVSSDGVTVDLVGFAADDFRVDMLALLTIDEMQADDIFTPELSSWHIDGVEQSGLSGWELIPDDSLRPNQRLLLGQLTESAGLSGKSAVCLLKGDPEQSSGLDLSMPIFSEGVDIKISIPVGERNTVTLSDKPFHSGKLVRAVISPLSCALEFDLSLREEIMDDMSTGMSLTLKDGSVIDWRGHFTTFNAVVDGNIYRLVYTFRVPLNPSKVSSLSFMDTNWEFE